MQSAIDKGVLEDLIETLEDGAQGYEQAAELLEDDGGAPLASEMRTLSEQRRRFSAELREVAAGAGAPTNETGSAGAALHRAWMSIKGAGGGTDIAAILAAVETGEDHAVAEFDEALGTDALSDTVRPVVERQAESIRTARSDVRDLLKQARA